MDCNADIGYQRSVAHGKLRLVNRSGTELYNPYYGLNIMLG